MSEWHGGVGTYADVVLLTLVALPVVALVAWALARRRRTSGSPSALAWRNSLAEVGIAYGTLPFVWLTMLPGSRAGEVDGQLSLVPLRDLITMPAYQVLGNLLGFAAFGALAPVRYAALASGRRILALAAVGSVLIETAQYVLRLDRVSSVDDVLLNAAGAGLGALTTRRWARPRPSPAVRRALRAPRLRGTT